MDIIMIFNGLGNQMSQYALYLAKRQAGQTVDYICYNSGHNGIELQRLFGINTQTSLRQFVLKKCLSILTTKRRSLLVSPLRRIFHLLGIRLYEENFNYCCQEAALKAGTGWRFLVGGWHHPQYFETYRQEILQAFSFPHFTDQRNVAIANNDKTQAVAIHIRKGDYMDEHNYERYGAVCTDAYYENAICQIEKEVADPHFYIFSNDKAWAQKIIGSRKATFVDWNTGENSWQDMALMTLFPRLVIANSTFSWWAAWLGEQEQRIIYRPPFFVNNDPSSNIYPEQWTMVHNK